MKNKVINAATCDARDVKEESLAGFDSIVINAALLIVGERSKELLNRYPVTMNTASVLEVPDGQNVTVKSVNGKFEIGPDADGTGFFLMVNGKLTIASDSADAVNSFYKIMVNGSILMPRSYEGQFGNISVNGSTKYYPDGAVILKPNTEIDDWFIMRAAGSVYYSPQNLFFLDTEMNTAAILSKNIRFAAKKIVIAESLLKKLFSQFDEEAEIIRVPDGTKYLDGDLELQPKTVRKYGSKLFVGGDVSLQDGEALSSLVYLYADGTVSLSKDLESEFERLECRYDNLKIIDPDAGYITDRPMVKVGAIIMKKYPSGVWIEDCAMVKLSKDLHPEVILEKLHISDCAVIECSAEQEDAVNMIAEDVPMIRVSGQDKGEKGSGLFGSIFDLSSEQIKNAQVINAAEYKM